MKKRVGAQRTYKTRDDDREAKDDAICGNRDAHVNDPVEVHL